MLKEYQSYIFTGIVQIFIVLSSIFLGLFFIIQLFGIISYIGGLTLSIKDFSTLFLLNLPNFFFYFSFPLTIITLIIFYKKLNSSNEFIILLSSGIKINEILKPGRIFILLIVLLSVYNSFYILPESRFLLDKKLKSILVDNSISMLNNPGLNIFKDNFVVLVRKNKVGNSILIYKEENEKNYIISADKFSLNNKKLILEDGKILQGNESSSGTSLIQFTKSIIDPNFLLNINKNTQKNYKEYTIVQLFKLMFVTGNNSMFNTYLVEINRRLLFSLVTVFIIWVALIPLISSRRYGGNNYYYIFPILLLIAFYIVSSVGRNMIYKGNYSGIIISWSILPISFIFQIYITSVIKRKT